MTECGSDRDKAAGFPPFFFSLGLATGRYAGDRVKKNFTNKTKGIENIVSRLTLSAVYAIIYTRFCGRRKAASRIVERE